METFFMNTENSKTNEPHMFKYNLIDKLNLKNPNRNMALANLSIYYTWKNVKSIYKNSNFKISAPTWNETFDLPDGSYNIPAIQSYFEYVIKKRDTDTAPILIYANKINNRILPKLLCTIKHVSNFKHKTTVLNFIAFYSIKQIRKNKTSFRSIFSYRQLSINFKT